MTPAMQELRDAEQRAYIAFAAHVNKGILPQDPKVPTLKLAQAWNRASVARKAQEIAEMVGIAAENSR